MSPRRIVISNEQYLLILHNMSLHCRTKQKGSICKQILYLGSAGYCKIYQQWCVHCISLLMSTCMTPSVHLLFSLYIHNVETSDLTQAYNTNGNTTPSSQNHIIALLVQIMCNTFAKTQSVQSTKGSGRYHSALQSQKAVSASQILPFCFSEQYSFVHTVS